MPIPAQTGRTAEFTGQLGSALSQLGQVLLGGLPPYLPCVPVGPPQPEIGEACGCSPDRCNPGDETILPIALAVSLECCASNDSPSALPGTHPFYRLDGSATFLDASSSLVAVFRGRTATPGCGDFAFGAVVSGGAFTTSQVNPGSGNLVLQISIPRSGPFDPLPVLTYNSFAIGATELGAGWTGTFQRRVFPASATAAGVATGARKLLLYTDLSGGFYTAPPGATNSLQQVGSTWVETQPNGLAFKYDSSGALNTIQNRAGSRWTMTSAGGCAVASVTDPFSRRTSFVYDGSGNIRRIQEPGGRITSFTCAGPNSERRCS